MELIKQLNEMADELMDQETFDRLVKFTLEEIKHQGGLEIGNDKLLEIIHSLIENVAGYEEADAASELANRVLEAVMDRIARNARTRSAVEKS